MFVCCICDTFNLLYYILFTAYFCSVGLFLSIFGVASLSGCSSLYRPLCTVHVHYEYLSNGAFNAHVSPVYVVIESGLEQAQHHRAEPESASASGWPPYPVQPALHCFIFYQAAHVTVNCTTQPPPPLACLPLIPSPSLSLHASVRDTCQSRHPLSFDYHHPGYQWLSLVVSVSKSGGFSS